MNTQIVNYAKAEQLYDIPESSLKTILILMENKHILSIDFDFYDHCVITPIHCEMVGEESI